MNKIYKDKEQYEQLILKVSQDLHINETIIEKDFYVTLILKELVKRCPNIIFKGGTSLSKCFKLINRFSEDIDISFNGNASQGERRLINHTIMDIVEELGFELSNKDEIKSRRDYNKFEIEYPAIFKLDALKKRVVIETVFSINAYPTEKKIATSIIYDYLEKNQLINLINEFKNEPFEVCVQSINRTFIDKIFAICDYYISGDIKEHSRHLYDIFKLMPIIHFDNDFIELVKKIRKDRKEKKYCFSADEKYKINELLDKIIKEEIYKSDYKNVTEKILYESVSYDDTIETIKSIIEKNVL